MARFGPVDLVRAFDAMHTLNLSLVELFHRVPLLLAPTVAGQPPAMGTSSGLVNGELSVGWVALTYPFNLTRSPAGTVCTGFTSDGMPIGLQVIGPQHADVAVLRLLKVIEETLALDTIAPLP
jgi:aspartyl-tRNA(Asn)/glutamyl-tRNA(Gln) amidotransferase subunit A